VPTAEGWRSGEVVGGSSQSKGRKAQEKHRLCPPNWRWAHGFGSRHVGRLLTHRFATRQALGLSIGAGQSQSQGQNTSHQCRPDFHDVFLFKDLSV
jgi:hypothetical protein